MRLVQKKEAPNFGGDPETLGVMVRAEGIEPSIQAWEAHVLPLYYARGV